MRKTFTLLIALLALAVSSWAQTQIGPINGLYYQIDDYTGEATLIQDPAQSGTWQSYGYSISGALFLPGTVNYNSTDYPVTSIGEKAFIQCRGIAYVSVEEGVKSIGSSAFSSCTARIVTLPSTIEDLGAAFAFSYLKTIIVKATTPPTFDRSFDDASSLEHIYVPAASVAAYKAAEGWANHASIIEAIPATPALVTWDATDLSTIHILGGPQAAEPTITIDNVTVVANAPDDSGNDYSHLIYDYGYTGFSMNNNGSLLFTSFLGNLTSIVITCDMSPSDMTLASGWTWNSGNNQLKWTGDAASVVLMGDGSSTYFTSGPITSIGFTVASGAAPVVPTPSTPTGPSFTWTARQINLVDLSCYNEGGKEQENGLINNIITSLTQTRDKNEDYNDPSTVESCQFNYGRIEISGCGDLKFKSIAGDLTGIVITGDIWTATDLPANWTYDDVANTLTWVGTPAEEVTLSGNLSIEVSSIEYFYDPAAAPRLGDEFYDSYQWYEITGAHTAKAIRPRNLSGTVDIPESVEDQGVTYYINEIAENAFRNYNQLSNAFIGENVAVIGAHAFDGCSQITEITIDSRVVESIGDEAFKNCLLLHGIELYNSLPPVLGSSAFDGDTRLNHIDVYSWVVSNYQGATNWSDYSSKITALWSARAIGERFFYHNQKTTGVYEITSVSPKEVKVLPYPADVEAIYPITYESSLIIPESPSYMHYGYSVTGIAANAFKDITDFKSVSIPQTIKTIEAGAFSGCTNVEQVFFLWDDPTTVTWADRTVGAEFATAASSNTTIIVPANRLAAYQTWAPAWSSRMIGGDIEDVTASQDPHDVVFYRTYYDGTHDLLLPPDVWAYVGYVNNNEFILRPIAFDGEIVPAGTAVVLRSFSPSYRLITMAPVAQPYTGTNQLRGSDVNITIASDPELSTKTDRIYVLGKDGWVNSERQEGMGLYRYTGTTLGAHKAYLIYNGPGSGSSDQQNAPARFLFKREDMATDIYQVQSGEQVQSKKVLRDGQLFILRGDKVYNAQGQVVK